MKITFGLFLLVLMISACEWGSTPKKQPHDIFKDTLAYTYQSIHERASDCGDKADSACTVVTIRYPLFKGQQILNDTVESALVHTFMVTEKPSGSYKQLAATLLKLYTGDVAQNKRDGLFYTLQLDAKVVAQDSALVAMRYTGYTFLGGAHGSSFDGFINWNPKTGKKIALEDIIADGAMPEFNKTAERIFRRAEKLKDTSSLARDYFFQEDRFALNRNFSITPTGLLFVYNQYEIKPYAAGKTELLLPYTEIGKYLRPGSAAAQFINKTDAGI